MDIGIPIPNITRPSGRAAIERIAGAADELGYHSVWLGDHIVRPLGTGGMDYFAGSDRYRWDLYEPLVTAGYVAAATRRVRIGFGVLVLPYRNPVVAAKAIATLDQLSAGRVILGVGTGYWPGEFAALGVERARSGARTDEYIDAFRALWGSDTPTFRGEFVDVGDILFKPRPVQDPVPLWVGGMSDRAVTRALERGDGWHLPRFTVEGIRPQIARLRAAAERAGRSLDGFVVSNRPAVRFATEVSVPERPQHLAPGAPAPPAEPIAGPPEHVAAELARFRDEGVDHLVIDLHEGEEPAAIVAAMETFAAEVMPLLAGSGP